MKKFKPLDHANILVQLDDGRYGFHFVSDDPGVGSWAPIFGNPDGDQPFDTLQEAVAFAEAGFPGWAGGVGEIDNHLYKDRKFVPVMVFVET